MQSSVTVFIMELTCPLDSEHHLKEARIRKQNKVEYLQLLAEFDRLNIVNRYETVEISVLGHYQPSCIQQFKCFIDFIQPSLCNKSSLRKIIDDAAKTCISCSQRIFFARNCSEWTP